MKHLPDYIKTILYEQSETNETNALVRAQLVLDALTTNLEEADYIYAWAGVAFSRQNDNDITIKYCTEYIPLTKDKGCRENLQIILIRTYEKTNQHNEAFEVRFQQLEEAENKGHLLEDIAKAYENLKDWNNAIKYYELFIAASKYCDSETYWTLAKHYDSIGELENSAQYFKKAAMQESTKSCWLWLNTGRAYALNGNEEEAMKYFQLVLVINPKEAMAHYSIGQVYQNKSDIYRALHHYTEALKIDPSMAIVYNNMAAIAFNEDGNITEAITNVEKALELIDNDKKLLVLLYQNLAKLYDKISDYDKQEYYTNKMMQVIGFPTELGDEDE